MEDWLLENTKRFTTLVDAHNLKATKESLTAKPKANNAVESDITIVGRIRPLLEDEVESGQVPGVVARPGSSSTMDLHEMRRPIKPTAPPTLTSSSYGVDKVFGPDASTPDLYAEVVKPLVPWAWIGGVSTLFAYGQTGSGKTHTVSGLEMLIAETLFSSSELEGERNIYISVIELAGKNAFDLLNARRPVSILEDSFGSTHFAGASDLHVTDSATLLKHIEDAASFRRTEPTLKNNTSSRSHAICKIRLENPALPSQEDGVLYLIDLAGSEAARDKSTHSAERMNEAREINTSLSTLKDCIRGRASADPLGSKPAYVPFRQAQLTKVLKHVFDPAADRMCKTVVIACINPSFLDVGASKSTLRYAALLKGTPPKAVKPRFDASRPMTWTNDEVKAWIEKNSGTPVVAADLLAPTETGRQLLRLPAPEFIARCLKTQGVSADQAIAFQSKFWAMHIESGKTHAPKFKPNANAGNMPSVDSSSSNTPATGLSTNGTTPPSRGDGETSSTNFFTAYLDAKEAGTKSRDPRPEMSNVPFMERLRPGMVVSWNPPNEPGMVCMPGRNLAILLAPAQEEGKWTAGLVTPAVLPGAFEVHPWQQFAAATDRFVAEVLLEYEAGSRYYYETV